DLQLPRLRHERKTQLDAVWFLDKGKSPAGGAGLLLSGESVARSWSGGGRRAGNVRGLQTLVGLPYLELYFLSLGQRLESFHRDCREVNEHILAVRLLNEAIALGVIEPLHPPSGH